MDGVSGPGLPSAGAKPGGRIDAVMEGLEGISDEPTTVGGGRSRRVRRRRARDDAGRTSARIVVEQKDLTGGEEATRVFNRCRRLLGGRAGTDRLVLDLQRVASADTKLAAFLVDLYQRSQETGVVLEIVPSPAVERIMSVCRLRDLLDRTRPRHG